MRPLTAHRGMGRRTVKLLLMRRVKIQTVLDCAAWILHAGRSGVVEDGASCPEITVTYNHN